MADHHPVRKRFGQHFLHDPAVVNRIVEAFNPRAREHIVEIGPGQGVLTRALCARVDQAIDVIEIDRDLAAALESDPVLGPRLNVHQGDVLKFDFAQLTQAHGRSLRIVGNLPYTISSPLLFRLCEIEDRLVDLTFMLQKEVVERIVAPPNTRTYGRLSVMLGVYFDAEHLFDVGPGAFKPPPKVRSAIVRFKPRASGPLARGDHGLFAELVRRAFSARRKTLRNAWRGVIEPSSLTALGIDPALRAENLTAEEFAAVAVHLSTATPTAD